MKAVVVVDGEVTSAHGMEAVLERRGFIVLRAATTEEAVKLIKNGHPTVDLIIAEAPGGDCVAQTEAAVRIHQGSPDIPILLVSDVPLEKWPEANFLQFGELLSGRVDLLVRPLTQASFMAKAHALIYRVSYGESRRLFESAAAMRSNSPKFSSRVMSNNGSPLV